jgi:RNA polymerase sigma factor (sigma-70 family)
MARMRRDVAPPAKEDLLQDARFGLWRGILRWDPDGGASAYTFCWAWAQATAQRGHLANDLDGLKSVKGWRVDPRVVARRLDAPLSVERSGKPDERLLGDTLAAPEADDTEERQEEARRQIAALLPTLEPREREIVEAYLRSEKHTLRSAGNEAGISRERVRQIFAGIAKRKGRAKPPPPPTLATDILNHLRAASRPSTVRELANRLGTSDRAVKRALDKLCADGVAAPISAKRAHGAVAYIQKEPDMPNDSAPRVLSREVVLPVLIANPNATPAELAAALGGLSPADTDRAEAQASWLRTTGQVPGIAPSGLAKRILGYIATHPGATSADIVEATGAQLKSVQRAASGLEHANLVNVNGRPNRYYLPAPEPAPMPAPTDPAPTSEPTPTPAPTDPTPASIPCPDLADALGIEDTDATPAELLDAVRALNRPRPDPRVAQMERQIAELTARINEETRRADDADRDLRAARLGWSDAAPPTLTAEDMQRRVNLWVKAAEKESLAALAADLPGLLPGEAQVLRDHRLAVAADLRARALRGEVCDAR